MGKLSILRLLSCLVFWFAGWAFAVDSAELLPPDQAFQFTSTVKKADRLLLSWDIADGYYLYRNKFKSIPLIPGIKVIEQPFPLAILSMMPLSALWKLIGATLTWKSSYSARGLNWMNWY